MHEIVRRQTRGLKFSCKKIFIFHFNNTESKYTFRRHEQHGGSVALMTLSNEIAITCKININSILHYMLIVYNFKCYCKFNVLIEYFEKKSYNLIRDTFLITLFHLSFRHSNSISFPSIFQFWVLMKWCETKEAQK